MSLRMVRVLTPNRSARSAPDQSRRDSRRVKTRSRRSEVLSIFGFDTESYLGTKRSAIANSLNQAKQAPKTSPDKERKHDRRRVPYPGDPRHAWSGHGT